MAEKVEHYICNMHGHYWERAYRQSATGRQMYARCMRCDAEREPEPIRMTTRTDVAPLERNS